MSWFVVRHPETGGVGCISDEAVDLHLARGWELVSDAISEDARAHFNPADWADTNLDAAEVSQPEPDDDPAELEE